jgi:hypothetical protein
MTATTDWTSIVQELARWQGAGLVPRLWLRDDDAVAVTPALEWLAAVTEAADIPLVLAVIPARAEPALAEFVARRPRWRVAVHGLAHANHAPVGEKKAELGANRPRAAVLADVAEGLSRLEALIPGQLLPMLVPPWNRIDPAVVPDLPALGIEVLSAFGPEPSDAAPRPHRLNAHLDLIDWRGGRRGIAPHVFAARLTESLKEARLAGGRPVGVLTHHLVHDEAAWGLLEALTAFIARRPDVAWWSPEWMPTAAAFSRLTTS